jgi:hypothetical protein
VDLHGRMFKQLEAEDRRDSEIKKARSDWVSIIVAVFALVISLKATYDASRSADIAAESLKVQEKAMEASQRPFIGVENPSIRSGKAVLQLRVYGNAPAKVVSISTSCEFTHFPPRAEDGGGDSGDFAEGNNEGEVLNPGSIRLVRCEPQDGASKVLSRGFTFKGEVRYRDTFGKQHRTS